MDDTLFWSHPDADEHDEQEAMLWAEARLEADRRADYWAVRKIRPGYPVTLMADRQEVYSFAWEAAKIEPTQSDIDIERSAVECFLVRHGSWQSGTPRRLSVLQRARRLTVSEGLTKDEWAEAAALVSARRDSRNTRERNARSRRAA